MKITEQNKFKGRILSENNIIELETNNKSINKKLNHLKFLKMLSNDYLFNKKSQSYKYRIVG
jgi:hypothetical protein